jgi:phosphomannomutase
MRNSFGTEPLVRVMVEGVDPVQVHSLAARLAVVVRERTGA